MCDVACPRGPKKVFITPYFGASAQGTLRTNFPLHHFAQRAAIAKIFTTFQIAMFVGNLLWELQQWPVSTPVHCSVLAPLDDLPG
jgi:hypothetical protein